MPLNELASPLRLVGVRQVKRFLKSGKLQKLFLAGDAGEGLIRDLAREAQEQGLEVEYADSSAFLGRACAIERPAAAAGLKKEG